jgi:hypothetical protein
LTPRRALDELDTLVRRMWAKGGKGAGHWQVSQVHLAHDVANAPILEDWRDRFVSRSRSRAQYEASREQLDALRRVLRGFHGGDDSGYEDGYVDGDDDSEEALTWGVDWDTEYGFDDADASGDWNPFEPLGRSGDDDDDPFRAVTRYTTGRRLTGFTWSPGGAISVVLYRKDWELGRRRRAYMEPLWTAAGVHGTTVDGGGLAAGRASHPLRGTPAARSHPGPAPAQRAGCACVG